MCYIITNKVADTAFAAVHRLSQKLFILPVLPVSSEYRMRVLWEVNTDLFVLNDVRGYVKSLIYMQSHRKNLEFRIEVFDYHGNAKNCKLALEWSA